ncbi:cellular tumor antigen p53 isoform X2 [Homalodisca vitripennis]|uniref:cellular tumor antigen p53 isoform X2 n=1 Tax=Homalodisca vitripennis TaxID=197043 RepID=UPI001EEA2856|nr:cellular tumor antigen p53 isoform X2 [Homalodisca vitripennis]
MDSNTDTGFMNSSDYEQIINDLKADSTFCEYKFSPSEITDYVKMEDVADSTDEHKLVIAYSPTCTLPCTDSYPGPYNFELMLDGSTSHKRSWVYSEMLQKVFIDINKTLLIQFRLSPNAGDLRVRALPVYSIADFLNIPVQRCALHMLNSDPQHQAHSEDNKVCYCANYSWVRHVVQSSHAAAIYDYDSASDRHSVVVPLDSPQPGSETVVVAYHFTCKTSCPQGMQRRPISVVFTLETSQGDVVGRQCLSVKICSCPKRDKEREEADNPLSEGWSMLDTCTKPKKRSSDHKYGSSKKSKQDNNHQIKAVSQLDQKKYDDIKSILMALCEQIGLLAENQNKLMDMMARMEDSQTKMIDALLQMLRQSS